MLEEQAARQQQAHGRRSVFGMLKDLIGCHPLAITSPNQHSSLREPQLCLGTPTSYCRQGKSTSLNSIDGRASHREKGPPYCTIRNAQRGIHIHYMRSKDGGSTSKPHDGRTSRRLLDNGSGDGRAVVVVMVRSKRMNYNRAS